MDPENLEQTLKKKQDLIFISSEVSKGCALEVFNHFKENNYELISKAETLISKYYKSVIEQKFPKTIGISCAYAVLHEAGMRSSYEYYHVKFKIDTESLKSCLNQIKNIKKN